MLPTKYYQVHTVKLVDKNDNKLNDFYKSYLQKLLAYNLNYIAFCCRAIGIPAFDQKKVAKMALATVRLWLKSNHSSTGFVMFCAFENSDYEMCKDLISTSYYFPL